jgi:hypothetical protein
MVSVPQLCQARFLRKVVILAASTNCGCFVHP